MGQSHERLATIPGYVSHKGFIAEDGERLTLVEFESEESMRTWSSWSPARRPAASSAKAGAALGEELAFVVLAFLADVEGRQRPVVTHHAGPHLAALALAVAQFVQVQHRAPPCICAAARPVAPAPRMGRR